jgi:hypothetical protein
MVAELGINPILKYGNFSNEPEAAALHGSIGNRDYMAFQMPQNKNIEKCRYLEIGYFQIRTISQSSYGENLWIKQTKAANDSNWLRIGI